MLLNLRETLWAMKNSDVNAVQLWLRVINFMQQMGRHYSSIQFKVSGTAPKDFIIPANQALHMVLVIQETVNNAVKHAGATTISAQSTLYEKVWAIVLQDDGSGFDIGKAMAEEDRYGLKHIQERALAGSFICQIESVPGNGTKTTLQISDNR